MLTDGDGGQISGYTIVRTTTGATVAELPPGRLAYGLSGGGDIAEAYLARPSSSGGTEIDSVLPNQGFALRPAASNEGSASAAVLARADLASFVGQPTVLVLLTSAGLAGYQHGKLIWSTPVDSSTIDLRKLGDGVYLEDGRGWAAVAPAIGSRGPIAISGSCQPGPIAQVGVALLVDCSGTLSGSLQKVPGDPPAAVGLPGAALLLFALGDVWRATSTTARRIATGIPWTAAPIAAPDGRMVYIPTAAGVERLDPDTGSHSRLESGEGTTSIALSRDGNFLYLIAAGRFATYPSTGGAAIGSFSTNRTDIALVAGG